MTRPVVAAGVDRLIPLAAALAILCRPVHAETSCDKLVRPDSAAGDFFGYSLAISGNVAVVGAHADDDGGSGSGSAYVFRWNGVAWEQEQKLVASDPAAGDSLGLSVSISGDVALVGAYSDDDAGSSSGSAYVFRWNGVAWEQEQKLVASDAAVGDSLGLSVSISGDVAVVGAHADDDNGSSSGSAYVFRWNGVAWEQEQKLVASDAAAGDSLGLSVSVSGDTALVGATSDDDNGSSSGSAYLFRWNGASWEQEQKLLPSDGAPDDLFGISVATSGGVALVGAYGDDDSGSGSGSAYVFRWNGATWEQEQKLLASDGAAADSFGFSVSAAGGVALAGAYGADDNGAGSGAAYVFRPCPWDCADGDGQVGITDFLAALGQWGQAGTSCDLDGGGVGIVDFLELLGHWGPCALATGACCDGAATGTCIIRAQDACESGGGFYAGDCTDCADGDGDRIPDHFERGDCAVAAGAGTGCLSGTDPTIPDTDGDGILDGDEFYGTAGGLDLPAMGLDPCHKDILVEVDWVYAPGQPPDWNRLHDNQAVALIAAFAASGVPNPDGVPGVTLHIDLGQAPYGGGAAVPDPAGNDSVDVPNFGFSGSGEYFAIKAAGFAANRHGYFHYCLMCNSYSVGGNYVNSSGLAELPGDDFLVSMGQWTTGDDDRIGRLFMHELGHNLDLRHGGYEDLNYKPNYNSVMNYRHAFCGADVDFDSIPDGALDYSRGLNINLNENTLAEGAGVSGLGPGIDWNGDGDTADTVVRNVNCALANDFFCFRQFLLTESCGVQGPCDGAFCGALNDFDDWAAVELQHLNEADLGGEVIHCILDGPPLIVPRR